MPIDDPTFPNEEEIPLNAPTAILTSSGCANPGNAVDDDPTTYAKFGAIGSGTNSASGTGNYTGGTNASPSIVVDATTADLTYWSQSQPGGVYWVEYLTGAWQWGTGLQTPWKAGPVDVSNGSYRYQYLNIGSSNSVNSSPPNQRAFTAADNNKTLEITSAAGPGFNPGKYTIVSTSGGSAYLDRSPGTVGSSSSAEGSGLLYAANGTYEMYANWVSNENSQFSTQSAAQTAASGSKVSFTHPSGPIGAYVQDGYYGDNSNGSPSPTLRLVGPQPTVSITGPSTGLPNSTVTLTWTSNATSASISPGVGPVFGASGSVQVVLPASGSVTYTITGITDGFTNAVASITITIVPRYLRVDWGFDALIGRVRFKQEMPGGGPSNTGIDFESSLGYLEGARPPPDVPFNTYIPLPLDAVVHELTLDPPFFARGIVVFPDAFAGSPNSYPEVDLYQLQVYQSVLGANTMPQTGPNPTIQWSTVGVQEIDIYPYVSGSSYSTLPAASLCSLFGLQGFAVSKTSKLAIVTGGETVEDIDGYETGRETKIKITNELADMRYFYLVFGGQLTVDPKNVNGPEVQYWVEQLTDRAAYVTIVAKGTNGNPNKNLYLPKCKIDGTFSFDMQKDKVTDIDMEFRQFRDTTWIRQDGTVGASSEWIFTDNATPALHS